MYLLENSFILIFVLVFFYFKFGILSPLFAYLASFILLFFIFLPFFLEIYPYFKFKFKFSRQLTKKMFKFGIPLTLASIGSMVIVYTDTLILTYFRPLQEVGIYNVVVPTAMLLCFFNTSVSQVMFPMISELWAKNLKNYLAKAASLLQKYSFAIVVPPALIMFSFPTILLKLLFGEAYVSGALALQLLVIGLVFFVVAGINMTILSGIGKPGVSTKIILIGALFNFLTNFYFIPKYGMVGAAITSLVSYFLILVLSAFYLAKFVKIEIPWVSWIKIFFSGAVFVLTIYLLKILLDINPYLEAAISIIIAGAVYLGLIFLFKVADLAEIKSLLIRKT
jgi:O-antigen/teichoic acid export membrane protein